jgi:Cbb3-type cytochrome oxidase component FixQ.
MFKSVMNVDFLTIWPTIAMLIFFTIMVLVFFWVWRPQSKTAYAKMEKMVFDAREQEKLS